MLTQPYLTPDMWKRICSYPKGKREAAMKIVGREEFRRCADDITYWLDPSRHLIPYVYTRDPKPMHACIHCADGQGHHFDKRQIHLLNSHGIEAARETELRAH